MNNLRVRDYYRVALKKLRKYSLLTKETERSIDEKYK